MKFYKMKEFNNIIETSETNTILKLFIFTKEKHLLLQVNYSF